MFGARTCYGRNVIFAESHGTIKEAVVGDWHCFVILLASLKKREIGHVLIIKHWDREREHKRPEDPKPKERDMERMK